MPGKTTSEARDVQSGILARICHRRGLYGIRLLGFAAAMKRKAQDTIAKMACCPPDNIALVDFPEPGIHFYGCTGFADAQIDKLYNAGCQKLLHIDLESGTYTICWTFKFKKGAS